jgi:hypothetical protein
MPSHSVFEFGMTFPVYFVQSSNHTVEFVHWVKCARQTIVKLLNMFPALLSMLCYSLTKHFVEHEIE